MSDTPQTDTFIMEQTALSMTSSVAEFARKLERERNKAMSHRAELIGVVNTLRNIKLVEQISLDNLYALIS